MLRYVVLILILISIAACFHDKDETLNCEIDIDFQMKIYKPDESLQCEEDSGIDLDTMSEELINAGIDVMCAEKGNDGRPVVLACGFPGGGINIFVINKSNLPDAEILGFKPLEELPEYVILEKL